MSPDPIHTSTCLQEGLDVGGVARDFFNRAALELYQPEHKLFKERVLRVVGVVGVASGVGGGQVAGGCEW